MSTDSENPTLSAAEVVRTIEQRLANDMISMIRKHRPLNQQESRLLESLVAEIGTKYGVLPPQEGFKIERIEEKLPLDNQWF